MRHRVFRLVPVVMLLLCYYVMLLMLLMLLMLINAIRPNVINLNNASNTITGNAITVGRPYRSLVGLL